MQVTYRFYREPLLEGWIDDYVWYVDIPDWPGVKEELAMVQGADTMLDYISGTKNEVVLNLSTEPVLGYSKLTFLNYGGSEYGGAFYYLDKYDDFDADITMWLCDVTLFVFGNFPKEIYIKEV